jgi:hypothetical protein
MKDAILQMLSVALDRKGTPLTVVYYDPNQPLFDAGNGQISGMAAQSARNNPSMAINPAEAAKRAFKNIHNDSVIYLPGKQGEQFNATSLSQQSNASDFLLAADFCNKGIMRGLLIPALLLGDGSGGYALGDVHSKTFEKVLDGMNAGAEEVILKQWVRDIIVLNFPKSAYEKDGLGSFGKRELNQDEIQKVMETFEKGIQNGIIDQGDLADLNKMRDAINFDEVDKPIERQGIMEMENDQDGGEINTQNDDQEEPEDKKLRAKFSRWIKGFFQ